MRMPVIIRPEDEERWLDPAATSTNDFCSAPRPYVSGQLTAYEVSPDVHSPKLKQPRRIDHI